ncbi:PAS domain S-box protein [Sphingomonas sp. HF-S3]|uniref:histidine kinase n=2 Tax=Sphingomonas rustica TaxID=3103142 RepID=A0ABV0BE35_9SPHN
MAVRRMTAPGDDARVRGDWPQGRALAIAFAALACACALLSLSGWVVGSRVIAGLGDPLHPPWPWTSIGYIALSLGFVLAIHGRTTAARTLWLVPIAIALTALIQTAWHMDLGVDRILLPEPLRDMAPPNAGRPGATPTSLLLMFAAAGLIASSRRLRHDALASLLASGALGLATAAGVLLIFAFPDDPLAQLYRLSIPSAIIALCLMASFTFWQSSFGWVQALTEKQAGTRLFQMLLPAALTFPVLPLLIQAMFERSGVMSPFAAASLAMVFNILAIGLVSYWAVRRVSQEHAALNNTLQALRSSQERLASATSAHKLGVFEWDAATDRFDWSPGAEELLGLVPGGISNFEDWRNQTDPEDAESLVAALRIAVAEGAETFSFRYHLTQPNGPRRALEGSLRCFYDDRGRLTRTVGVVMDVTERDASEAALRARAAQLRSILATVPDAMVVVDQQGAVRQFSAAAERLWGYHADTVLGQDMGMLAPEEDREQNITSLRRFIADRDTGAVAPTRTVLGLSAAGDRVPLEVRSGLARTDEGPLVTMFFRDITARLETERRMVDLGTDLAHVSRQSAMSELASDIAHELNQPLTATANFLAAARILLEQGKTGERVEDMLQLGIDQTQRAGQILRRLRDFASGGDVEMRPESVERTVRDAVDLALVGSSQFYLDLVCEFDPQAPQIFVDRIQIQQVLVNLLRNANEALKAIPRDKRRLEITSNSIDQSWVAIEVSDNGPGIPENILNQLFSRFTTTKGGGGGMGIGLSISRRIIESHGGTLTAENRMEGGAKFRFTLPAEEQGEE